MEGSQQHIGTRMVQVYCYVRDEGYMGATPAAIAMDTGITYPDVLRIVGNLHRGGYFSRLQHQLHSPVYVLPENVDGRTTEPYRPSRKFPDWDDDDIMFALAAVGMDVPVEMVKRFLQVLA